MKAMILSAGLGTRLRPVTNHIPKPAVPFLGIPIALYAVEYALEVGATEIVLNTFYLADELKRELTPFLDKLPVDYHFVDETGSILGSGGGLKNASDHFRNEDSILLCNGDEIILPHSLNSFQHFKEEHIRNKRTCSLFCMEHPEAGKKFGGVWTNSEQSILGFGREAVKDASKTLHYTGLALFDPKILEFLPEGESNILYDGAISAIEAGEKVFANTCETNWFETGNEDDFIAAHDFILKNWENPMNDIIKKAIHRFGSDELKNSLPLSGKPAMNIGQHTNEAGNDWNILLDKKISKEAISRFKNCVIIDSSSVSGSQDLVVSKIVI